MIGNTLSHYQIIEKLDQGGMVEVYPAEDSRLDRNRGCSIMIGKKQVLFAVLFLLSVLSLSPARVWAQGGGGDEGEGGDRGGGDQGQQQPQEQESDSHLTTSRLSALENYGLLG